MPPADIFDPRLRSPVSDITREVLIHGPILRSELSRRLGLSAATLTRLIKPLIDGGLVVELAESEDGAMGRPARPIDVRPEARRFIGVKLTGETAVAALTDMRANELRHLEVPLENHDVGHVVDVIERILQEFGGRHEITGIGISLGGSVIDQRIVGRAPFLGWAGVDLGTAVEDRVGMPVVVENDLVALTAAEHWFGLARGFRNFAVITVGAGVGYGAVVHDRIVNTPDTGLGLAGHIPLDPAGPLCFLGHHGCSTAMLTIPSIRAQAQVGLGRPVDYDDVLDLASAGNPVAREIVRSACRALGLLIADVANFAMAEHVILAGEGIGMVAVADGEMRAALAAGRSDEASVIDVLIDESGFTSWARGAAAVAIQSTLVDVATSA